MSDITIPRELILDRGIQGEPLLALLHLSACPTCWTVQGLHEHGFNRTTVKVSLDTLTRAGYYRRTATDIATGDILTMVEVATRPGQFGPPVCISRVFFAARDGLVKIDSTIVLPQKLQQLEREGGPIKLIANIQGGPGRRDKVHDLLSHLHEGDRWFRDSAGLRSYIAAVWE